MEGEVPGPSVSTDSRHMSTTLTHLENKISELKKFGDQLAMSMEGAAVNNAFYIFVFSVFLARMNKVQEELWHYPWCQHRR